jgi:xylulokinase
VGLTTPGLASVSTGTAEVVEVVLPSPVLSRPLYEGNISVYHHVVPGLFLAMTLNHSGGMSLRWFRDQFCEPQLHQSARSNADAYDLILAGASADPTGLLVLPHFSGSGTPTFDTGSKAAILGLTFATTRAEVAKAILEGLTYELRLNLDLLKTGGVKIDVLRAIGGGAKSALWLQLKADVTGIPVVTPGITEAAGFGAALLAGVGAGLFSSAAEAANRFLQLTNEYVPDPLRHSAYTRQFELYRQVYPAIAPITHQL